MSKNNTKRVEGGVYQRGMTSPHLLTYAPHSLTRNDAVVVLSRIVDSLDDGLDTLACAVWESVAITG
jgi:hypothetical protein